MESGARKILPRIRPSSAGHGHGHAQGPGDADLPIDAPNGHGRDDALALAAAGNGSGADVNNLKGWRPLYSDEGPPRKRQHVADTRAPPPPPPPPTHLLPGVQHLLVHGDPHQMEAQMSDDCRLVRSPHNGLYYNHGAFIFKSPAPHALEFPRSIAHDTRPYSFAVVEPDLMDIFQHAWYLRHYIRLRRSQGMDIWWDHKTLHDAYGIDNVLHMWASRHEPGSAQYPASMLYKTVLWLYFNRTIQPSMGTTGFRDVVDDGLHHFRTLDRALGAGDRSYLLVPLFLLGTTAFEERQRRELWGYFELTDPGGQSGAAAHAMSVLKSIWGIMDNSNSRVDTSWDWEVLSVPAITQNVMDRALVDLLRDPNQEYPPPRIRSPEVMPEFDNSRFRAMPMPNTGPPPQIPESELNTRNSSGDNGQQTPSQGISPTDASRLGAMREGSENHYGEPRQERTMSQPELAPVQPRPFLAPPPPGPPHLLSKDQVYDQMRFSRKIPQLVKNKSSVPPCPTCGKELKNPSDAQKHQLQHSKPFLCKEPGCTRNQGFATENDLQRHRKSVHGASPRIGNKIGYVCVECPEPSDGTQRKWWPRLDNFKAHIRRKHHGADEDALITASSTPRRQEDTFTDSGYIPGSDGYTPSHSQYQTPPDRPHHFADASQASADMEQATQESQTLPEVPPPLHHQQTADPDEGYEEEEEEEVDDGPVGPWELHRSFRANRRKRGPSTDEDEAVGEGEEGQSPAAAAPSASKHVKLADAGDEDEGTATPKANGSHDGSDGESKTPGPAVQDEMEVDTGEPVKREEKEGDANEARSHDGV